MKRKIFHIILFVILIPIFILIQSYLPGNRIRLYTESAWEYFYQNLLCNFSLKLLIAILLSGLITGGIYWLVEWIKKNYSSKK